VDRAIALYNQREF